MNRKISFKITILNVFIVFMLVIVSGITAAFYFKTSTIIMELADQVTKEVTEKIIEKTTSYLNVPAMQTITVSMLVQEQNIIAKHEEIWKYMWEQLMVLPQVQAIFVADGMGNYVQVRREPDFATRYIDRSQEPPLEKWVYRDQDYNIIGEEEKIGEFDPRIRPWYVNTKPFPMIYWTDVYIFTTAKTPGISATYPISDKNGKMIAVVCINSPLHSLSKFLSEQKVSKNGIVFIINEKDELVAYPDHSLTIRQDGSSGELRLTNMNELKESHILDAYNRYRETGEKKFFSMTGKKKYLVNFVPFPKSFVSRWQIVVIIPEKDLLGSVQDMVLHEMAIALVISLFSIIGIYFITHQITKSINSLSESTKKIKDFQLEDFLGVDSRFKEIDKMSNAMITATKGLSAFKKYVPAELVRQLIQLGDQAKLGGEKAELTILFSDIEGFTTIAEDMEPEFLMAHLSEYLESFTKTVMDRKGTIDKYIGDAVMAFWGAPVKLKNSPYLACKAALECQRNIEELNKKWKSEGKPIMPTRIGINTGITVVGNVGSKDRMNYTIVGDNVNLASRLEGINKLYGTKIIISEDTYKNVSGDFLCRPLDIAAVKGKAKGVRIYELISEWSEIIPEQVIRFCREFESGFQAYLKRDWEEAVKIFAALNESFPSEKSVQIYIERCGNFQNHDELPEDWDGTCVMNKKF